MSQTMKDLIISAVAGIAIMIVFASIELVEILFELTRKYEDWDLDEIIACIPALTIVAMWFAGRRWLEARGLNARLQETVGELEESLRERRAMEEQLREGYKVAAMGTFGGGFAAEIGGGMERIATLAREGASRAAADAANRAGFEGISEAARGIRTVVDRMLGIGDGGMRDTEVVAAADAVRESISLAAGEIDAGLLVDFRMKDGGAAVRVNPWELREVGTQLVSNAVEAMGAGGRLTVDLERTSLDADAAREQGLAAGDYVRIGVEDTGPGIPAAIRGHVFEPFFTTRGAGDGKGLGLAIAHSLVRGWNGNLSLGSAPGSGTRFQFLVPVHATSGS